eukprot:scaffold1616_cov310-Pinguiococcus_pyrenoidosus.AAC.22
MSPCPTPPGCPSDEARRVSAMQTRGCLEREHHRAKRRDRRALGICWQIPQTAPSMSSTSQPPNWKCCVPLHTPPLFPFSLLQAAPSFPPLDDRRIGCRASALQHRSASPLRDRLPSVISHTIFPHRFALSRRCKKSSTPQASCPSMAGDDDLSALELWPREETELLEIPLSPAVSLKIQQIGRSGSAWGLNSCVWSATLASIQAVLDGLSRCV